MVKLREERLSLNLGHDSTVKWEDDGIRYCVHVQCDDQPPNPREDWDCADIMACWHRNYCLGDKIDDKSPEDFWRRLVRENVSYNEIYAAVEDGKLTGIRLAPNGEDPERVDVYETYYLRTVIGNSEPGEYLEYEGLSKDGVVEYIMDDLTIRHCQTLMESYAEWLPLWLYDHSGITMSCGERNFPYDDPWDSGQVGWIVAVKETILAEVCSDESTWREHAIASMRASVAAYDQYLTGDVYSFALYAENESAVKDGTAEWTELDSYYGFFGSDIMENGLAEEVGHGLWEAVQEDRYELGEAKLNTVRYYTF